MSSREAAKLLVNAGFSFIRMGRGSHMIFERSGVRIVISAGSQQISSGMSAKVRSTIRKQCKQRLV